MTKSNGFIKVDRNLWQSEEWRSLSPHAQVALIDIWARFNGRNNGQIPYGVRDGMTRLHCGSATAQRALNELKDAGLIEVAVKASFDHKNGARKGRATQWRLTFLR